MQNRLRARKDLTESEGCEATVQDMSPAHGEVSALPLPLAKDVFGAVVGDIVGSVYEGNPIKDIDFFPLFSSRGGYTDDTVLTMAVAHAILNDEDYGEALARFARKYSAGYGCRFDEWARSEQREPYNSWGNGSAMRVSPVGFAFNSVEEVLCEAEKTALPTHDHPEGIKGAQAVALAIFLARTGADKAEMKEEISRRFGYDLTRSLAEIRPTYFFKIACQESVPESIIAFLESHDFEEAVRNAVSLGGDADTMASIAGAIAQAYYGGVPQEIANAVRVQLPPEFLTIQQQFAFRFSGV
jgi:ADP-ribosylglycohydrolase